MIQLLTFYIGHVIYPDLPVQSIMLLEVIRNRVSDNV